MLAWLKREIVYARGLARVVSRTKVVTASPSKTLGDHLEDWARAWGDRNALTGDRESFSYRQLDERANRYARWAGARGLGKGHVVALMMPNRPEYLAVWFGLARAGVATALINTNLTAAALAHSLKVANAKAAIVESSLLPAIAPAREMLDPGFQLFVHGEAWSGFARVDYEIEAHSDSPLAREERPVLSINDAALFIYTSGTTGLPKAARITHSRALRLMLGISGAVDARLDDRMYLCLPMYHTNGGLLGPGTVLSVGGSCHIRENFSAREFWKDVVARDCTLFVYIGEVCRYLLNAPPSDHKHRVRLCFGNGLRPDIFEQFQQRFGIRQVLEFYGSTEGNAVLLNFDSHPGAVGRMPNWAASRFPVKLAAFDVVANEHKRDARGYCLECAPGEVGELLAEIRDDPKFPAARFDGYADPAATKAKIVRDAFRSGDAWFRTGDLLRRDARGYYYFVDRIGDTFRWKGENVSTTEVAETIAPFAGVKEATVYGVVVPHHEGRAGMAAIVVESIAEFDLEGLRAYLTARLPAYARPAFLRFRTNLDITGTYKQKKVDLVAEGFDPARVQDPMFRDDRAAGLYRPVDAAFIAAIESGTITL
jgi:fatty-acyl-CoA synthase